MAADPNATQLLPNTQPFYCNFNNFCRGGLARWLLAKGPARNLWVPLCDGCARSLLGQLPDGLLMHTLRAALEAGKMETLNRVFQEAAAKGVKPLFNWPAVMNETEFAKAGGPPGVAVIRTPPLSEEELVALANEPGQVIAVPTYDPRAVAIQYLKEHSEDDAFLALVEAILAGEELPEEGPEAPEAPGQPPAEPVKPADEGKAKPPVPRASAPKRASGSGKGTGNRRAASRSGKGK